MAFMLAGASGASGALVGFLGGVAGALVAPASTGVVVAVVAAVVLAALVLDLSPLPPLSVRRQVPQLWGRIFSARTTALLYGARLGVGPLTILRTWWWWAAFVLGALAGVWWSVLVGAVFGLARVVVMLVAGPRAASPSTRSTERAVTFVGALTGLAAVAAAVTLVAPVAPVADRRPVLGALEPAYGLGRPQNEVEVVPPADTGLGNELPGEIGDGYTRLPDDSDDGLGPLDLDAAVAVEQDPSAERALLETRRFQAGHARAWRSTGDTGPTGEDGVVVYAAVYRFASNADAAAYLTDGFLTLESRGARVADVDDPPGARTFSQATTDERGSRVAHGVAFVRDDRFFLVFESSRTSAASAEHALAIARGLAARGLAPTPPAQPTQRAQQR